MDEQETEAEVIQESQKVPEVKSKNKKRAKTQPPQTKLAIVQMPEDTDPELLEQIKQHLDEVVSKFDLEKSEVRLCKPDLGGRPKKYLTPEDEKAHYREYMKDYYKEKLNKPGVCPHCAKEFKTRTSINRHVKNSKNCLRFRVQKELFLQNHKVEEEAKAETEDSIINEIKVT
jgi:hypothetical protein